MEAEEVRYAAKIRDLKLALEAKTQNQTPETLASVKPRAEEGAEEGAGKGLEHCLVPAQRDV